MDEETLRRHRNLWSVEAAQYGASELATLTRAEADLYGNLKGNVFCQSVRLEQERVDWDWAWQAIKRAIK